ncbi:MAG: aminopeptidase P family protein [Paramuribaculum sp.]|nr:aminopeptidase P family protein [Paramuribaculum sp.]
MNEVIQARLKALRDQMRQSGVSATIIPQTDPHQSEYLSSHWQVRRWLTGFTGSAGDLLVTSDAAFLWADSRYWLQAAEQLAGTGVNVMEDGKPETPSMIDYICANLPAGSVVGVDGMLFSISATKNLISHLENAGLELKVNFSPIDNVWVERPSRPDSKVFVHDEKYAGAKAVDKMAAVLANASRQGATAAFISDLAEIAWILNLRGSDVNCNPVVTSFLYLSPAGSVLFIDEAKVDESVRKYLLDSGVTLKPYTEIATFLGALPEDERVLLSATQSAGALLGVLGIRAVVGTSPAAMLKAVKNDVQIAGVRNAMVRDGVALVHSFMEIERMVAANEPLTEMGVADLLLRNRKAGDLFFDLSFETIAGYAAHGAIVHYDPTPETDVRLFPENLLLVDSGANYFDGTTDITRTIALGEPTAQQRRDFTLVMKGHIAIAKAIYPEGTRGAQLDVLARINLWKEGLSYLHGTGHGVGHFLNVHEGPQSIRLNDTMAPLTPGMITSNEPGLYRAGLYGIRCENLVLTTEAFTTEFGKFYKFETLTLFPFDLTLFDTDIMSDEEIRWVNDYHDMVRERLTPHLDEAAAKWLEKKTAHLTR